MNLKQNSISITVCHILNMIYGSTVSLQVLLSVDCIAILVLLYKMSEYIELTRLKSKNLNDKPANWPSTAEICNTTIVK